MRLPKEIRKLRCGYAVINRTRQVCPKCGHKTSIYVKAEGRFCIYQGCEWRQEKEAKT